MIRTVILLLILPAVCLSPQDCILDVLELADGRELQGIIVERVPERSIMLETEDGTCTFIEQQEIISITSEKLKGRDCHEYRDVVFLKDGVIFDGTILEQQFGVSLSLLTRNGLHLVFQEEEIWKLGRQRITEARPVPKEQNKIEGWKTDLQISLVSSSLQKRREQGKDAGNEERKGLQEEVERLQQELEQLEREQELAAGRQRSDELQEELNALLEELLTRAGLPETELSEYPVPPETLKNANGSAETEIETTLASIRGLLWELESRADFGMEGSGPCPGRPPEEIQSEIEGCLAEMAGLAQADGRSMQNQPVLANQADKTLAAKIDLNELLQDKGRRTAEDRNHVDRLAATLSDEERRFLYSINKRSDQLKGVGLNLVPLLNIGSWLQGDWIGALVSYAITGGGIYLLVAHGLDYGKTASDEYGPYVYAGLNTLGYTGLGMIGFSWAFSLTEPVLFVRRWNGRLAETLQLER